MTQVDFYLLQTQASRERQVYACRLAEKAYSLGRRVYLLVSTPVEAKGLDDLLWTFRQGSFVPHSLSDAADACENPVLIGLSVPDTAGCDLLINLDVDLPHAWERLPRIAELIEADEESRQRGRERYRRYREGGAELVTHELG